MSENTSYSLAVTQNLDEILQRLLKAPGMVWSDDRFTLTRALADEDLVEISETTERLAITTNEVDGCGNWILGNVAYILREHGYDIENHLNKIPEARLVAASRTYEVFRDKRYKIPFTHHKEIACCANLKEEHRHIIASFAERKQISQKELRKVLRYAREAAKSADPILTDEALLNAINSETRVARAKTYAVFPSGNIRVIQEGFGDTSTESAICVFEGSIKRWLKGQLVAGGEGGSGLALVPSPEADPVRGEDDAPGDDQQADDSNDS